MPTLTDPEKAVLAVYVKLTREHPEGAFNPYWDEVAAAAGNADLAYAICKSLKAKGMLDANGAQRGGLLHAPAYWATDAALEAAS